MAPELQAKFKVTFDVINKEQEGEFMKENKFNWQRIIKVTIDN